MNARVLLIDGDAGWAHSAAGRLETVRPSLAVESCRSAARALKLAEKWPVALAVSNLVLPRPGSGRPWASGWSACAASAGRIDQPAFLKERLLR